MHGRARWLGSVAIALVLAAPVAGAQRPRRPATAFEAEALTRRFQEQLRAIDAALVAGDARAASKQAERLEREMIDHFTTGTGVSAYLGQLTVLRALAAYGLGERDEAVWHWQVALQLFPELEELTLGAYGDAGEFLRGHPPRAPRSAEEKADALPSDDPSLTPPQAHKQPRPRFPRARLGTGTTPVVIEAIIDEAGHAQEPLVLDSGGEPTMAYVALEALRQWEFEPARLNGEPVAVFYNLTVNFSSRR